jgi:CheY-like chemotaxis protein
MVKLLAELHGGVAAVESAVGTGSRFTVWLPFRLPNVKERRRVSGPVPTIAPVVASNTALVVDDDYKAAHLIRMQLEAEGFTVLHADSAESGLTAAARQPLALITLDIGLPNMDGWEFLSRIKNVPALSCIPVVIISIAADPSRGFALGAAAVMQKPLTNQALYGSLVQLGLLPGAQGEALKILIVDDDPVAVELIALHAQNMGSTVLRAHGGREAIETAHRELPDLVVLDLMLPDVNGFEVVMALREHPDTARIPVVVVTSKEITPEERATLNGYVTTIMAKGTFDRNCFLGEVRRAMSGRKASV